MMYILLFMLVAVVVGAIIGALLAALEGPTPFNRTVAVIVSGIMVFVIAFVVLAYLAAWGQYTLSTFGPFVDRTCEDGRVTHEEWFYYYSELPEEMKEIHERLKSAIIKELWLREIFPRPVCGPCYVLDEVDCKLYNRYVNADVGDLRVYIFLLAIVSGLTGGLVFGFRTRKR